MAEEKRWGVNNGDSLLVFQKQVVGHCRNGNTGTDGCQSHCLPRALKNLGLSLDESLYEVNFDIWVIRNPCLRPLSSFQTMLVSFSSAEIFPEVAALGNKHLEDRDI